MNKEYTILVTENASHIMHVHKVRETPKGKIMDYLIVGHGIPGGCMKGSAKYGIASSVDGQTSIYFDDSDNFLRILCKMPTGQESKAEFVVFSKALTKRTGKKTITFRISED